MNIKELVEELNEYEALLGENTEVYLVTDHGQDPTTPFNVDQSFMNEDGDEVHPDDFEGGERVILVIEG